MHQKSEKQSERERLMPSIGLLKRTVSNPRLVDQLIGIHGREGASHYLDVGVNLHRFGFSNALVEASLGHHAEGLDRGPRESIFGKMSPEALGLAKSYYGLTGKSINREDDFSGLFKRKGGLPLLDLLWLRAADRFSRLSDIHISDEDRAATAKASLAFYVPMLKEASHAEFAKELEDRAFQVLYPKLYGAIKEMRDEKIRGFRDENNRPLKLETIRENLEDLSLELGFASTVQVREKSVTSMFTKMFPAANILKLKEKAFTKSLIRKRMGSVPDTIGARYITPVGRDERGVPYYDSILYAIQSRLGGRFRVWHDYITHPKTNGYQSYHGCILDKNGRELVELQIRDEVMHRNAEYGGASHNSYKEKIWGVKSSIESDLATKRVLQAYFEFTAQHGFRSSSFNDPQFRLYFAKRKDIVGGGKIIVEASGYHLFPHSAVQRSTIADLVGIAHPLEGHTVKEVYATTPDGTEKQVDLDVVLQHGYSYRFVLGGPQRLKELMAYHQVPQTMKWLRAKIAETGKTQKR